MSLCEEDKIRSSSLSWSRIWNLLLSAWADRESFLETIVLICFFALEVMCVVNLLVTVVWEDWSCMECDYAKLSFVSFQCSDKWSVVCSILGPFTVNVSCETTYWWSWACLVFVQLFGEIWCYAFCGCCHSACYYSLRRYEFVWSVNFPNSCLLQCLDKYSSKGSFEIAYWWSWIWLFLVQIRLGSW